MSLTVVLGGTRSGKSEVAESVAASTGRPVAYITTAEPSDAEMAERIALHRARRPPDWRTFEAADPVEVLARTPEGTVVVDGLAPWIARLMSEHGLWTDADVAPLGNTGRAAKDRVLERVRAFGHAASSRSDDVIVVAEESGLGLVPEGAAVRRFLDLSGEGIQALSAAADRVILVVAGQPMELKGALPHAIPHELTVHGDAAMSRGCLNFAVNVSPLHPPSWLRARLEEALGSVSDYPDESEAIVALAGRHARAPVEVLPLNGAAEAFWLIAHAFRPKRAVCIHPQFTAAEAALRARGLDVDRTFRDPPGFHLDTDAVPQGADLVFVCNPNNPTGTLDPAGSLEALVSPGRLLVVDEAFMEFTVDEQESLASRADLPGTVVVRSITKLWGIPGLRAGYLLAPPDVVSLLKRVRQPWSVNSLALAALKATAEDEGTARKIAEQIAEARASLAEGLAELDGVRTWPSHANFILIEVPDGAALADRLARRGIAVRRADTFPGLSPNHLRIAVRRPQENRVLMRALREEI